MIIKNKVVFISGAARGLGGALAQAFYEEGAHVYCASRNGQKPKGLQDVSSSRLKTGLLDVCDYTSCETAIQDCLHKLGKIDVLLNNASAFTGGQKIGDYNPQDMLSEITTTLLGPIQLTNAFVKKAERKDFKQHVFFIGSTAGESNAADEHHALFPIYAAAKAGVSRFAECIQTSLQKNNTFVHTLVPSKIRDTNWASQSALSPKDVFEAITFLLSPSDNLYVQKLVLCPQNVEKRKE